VTSHLWSGLKGKSNCRDIITFIQHLTSSLANGTDKYYRVQVGPHAVAQAPTNARHGLEAKGFKSIVTR
jgi:hypothetical protein